MPKFSLHHKLLYLTATVLVGIRALAAPPLVQISPTLYKTEHCLFVIDASVTWTSPTTAYNEIYGAPFPKLSSAFDSLMAQFPNTYFSICYMANTGAASVPNYIDNIYKADGINETYNAVDPPNTFKTVDICRYNLAGGNLFVPVLAVYDHELGHAWGARAFYNLTPPSLSNGHWLSNSTVDCQMSATYSGDGGLTVNKLYGDPAGGFHWQKVDNLRSNDIETFSEQTLYLMGLRRQWPTAYVLNNPVYNADLTASYSSVDTFDHAAMVAAYGPRTPDYTTARKRFKLGFIYIARDAAEVNTVYQAVEKSIDHFCNAEAIDPHAYRFQTPFLADARFRASVDGLLADLDGNATPSLAVTDTYVQSSDGTAVVNFVAADPDGPVPAVTLVPASNRGAVVGSTVQISGLPDGVHFFTLKAADAGGKKVFGHFVVEVQRPASSTTLTGQPGSQTVVAGNPASFGVVATGPPANLTYQWFRQAAGESTWNNLSDAGAYSGSTTGTLTVASTTAMNGDEFQCLVSNGAGSVTSNAARLVVNETAPIFSTQPADRSVNSGNSVPFSVVAGGPATTFGYFYYQWQRQVTGSGTWNDLTDGGAYSGSGAATLHVVSGVPMNGDKFRCVVTNTAGAATSEVAALTVGLAPAITTQPVSPITVAAGQGASFTVIVTGTAPLAYQWSRYGVPVAGATSATLTILNAQANDAGAYTVAITNPFGSAGSNVGSLAVTAAAPTITADPPSTAVTVNQNVSFSVAATGSDPISYQWRKDGVPLAGATAATFSIGNVQSADAGSYTVRLTNSAGSTTSAAAILSVTKAAAQVTLSGLAATYDGSAHAAAAVTAPAALSVGFTYDGSTTAPTNAGTYVVIGTINDANYQGSASGSLVIAKAPATVTLGSLVATYDGSTHGSTSVTTPAALNVEFTYDGSTTAPTSVGTYAVVGTIDDTNYFGSASGTLTIGKATPVITWAAPAAIGVGTPLSGAQLNATADVAGTFVYNPASGTVLGLGVQTLNVTFTPTDTTNYNSTAAQQSLTVAVLPSITTQPASQTVGGGYPVTFSVTAGGNPAPTYQWRKNGVNIAGATNATYTIANPGAGDAGTYTVVITNANGTVTSAGAVLTVRFTTPADKRPTGGQRYLWFMNGTSKSGELALDTISTEWQIAGIGDFNADGKQDILWQNTNTGGRVIWLMNGSALTSVASLPDLPTEWQMAGTGDFNADGKTDILLQNTNTGERYVWLMNGTALSSSVFVEVLSVDWRIAGVGDFNGDTKPDILWQNTTTGERMVWMMNGTVHSSTVSLGIVPTEWQIAGAADFNADGKPDILWQNITTGERVVWGMNGTTLSTVTAISTVSPEWQIAGAADFNGDGKPDILWQAYLAPVPFKDFNGDSKADILWQNTTTGERQIWLMNGITPGSVVSLGIVSTDWRLAGSGDFNGDGQADLVWQNLTTGERKVWMMNGTTLVTEASLGSISGEWKMDCVGDIDGDGKSDILWQNANTGERYAWLMNGTQLVLGASLGTVALEWQIVGSGDFNGDGKSDILWQNVNTGERYVWLMRGAHQESGVSLGIVALEWQIAGTGDYNNDGKTDILWQNANTGERLIWIMNGTQLTLGVGLGTVPTDWSIVP